MRLEIHHKIGKKICGELKELGLELHEKLFLLGNLFPDLIHSYLWRRHEYRHSRNYLRKKLLMLRKRPRFFSFHLGIVTHYICDYFCYPHSSVYNKGFISHVLYELRQKVPSMQYRTSLDIKDCTVEELDTFVRRYEAFRTVSDGGDDADFHMAAAVASGFLQAAC
jgi:hypothetical protein